MTYYGGKEMAAAFRTVRGNTLKIAEEIPEGQIRLQTGALTAGPSGRRSTHIALSGPASSIHIHGNKITDLKTVNFPELMQRRDGGGGQDAQRKPRSSRFLKTEGEKFATFLEGLPESFLAEQVAMLPGARPATKSRFEMLLGSKEHEMHHRAQLMLVERMLGQVPHLTRQMQERMAADRRRQAARRRRQPMASPVRQRTLRFLRALKRNNRREWFNAHRDDYEGLRPPADDRDRRRGWRTTFAPFAPELVASPKTSMYRIYRDTRFSENKAPYKTHVAAVFPTRGLPKHEGAGAVLSRFARRSLDRRRHVFATDRRSCTPSASTSPPSSSGCARSWSRRPSAGNSARSRGTAATRAARLCQGSPGGRLSEATAIPCRPRVSADARDQSRASTRRCSRSTRRIIIARSTSYSSTGPPDCSNS